MLIYRFKVINDEVDDFYREIEIKPGNTFQDFHDLMVECIKLTPGEMASFYICDSRWNKLQEIALCDFSEEQDAGEESANVVKNMKIMADVTLKQSINDPNQRMIYVYDFLKMHTFYIELSKIMEGDQKHTYPRCTKSISDIVRLKKIPPKAVDIEKEEEIIDEDTDNFFDDDDLPADDGSIDLNDGFDDSKYL